MGGAGASLVITDLDAGRETWFFNTIGASASFAAGAFAEEGEGFDESVSDGIVPG
jgi:hypothetical protein